LARRAGAGFLAPELSDLAQGNKGDAPSPRAAGPMRSAIDASPRMGGRRETRKRCPRGHRVINHRVVRWRHESGAGKSPIFLGLQADGLGARGTAPRALGAAATWTERTSAAPAVFAACAWPRRKRCRGPPPPSGAASLAPADPTVAGRGD